ELGAVGTSYRGWGHRLLAQAQAGGEAGALSYWRGAVSEPCVSLVEGSLAGGRDVMGTAGELTLSLSGSVTGALLTRVPGAFHGGMNDVLLTGLGLALLGWVRRRGGGGSAAVLVDVEG